MERYPLRQSTWIQLGEWVGRDGARKVARLAQVAREELDQVVAAKVAPLVGDRVRLINALVRAGYSQGRGDPYRTDGTEQQYGLAEPRAAERRALASWALSSERD
ncbi:MAG TPA: hypothetical protein VFS67_35560 [Polyangiaceae bacterium]|nr:hypothetical protein [Polyangiaceae bacterium]